MERGYLGTEPSLASHTASSLFLHKDVSGWLCGHRLYASAIEVSNKTLFCSSIAICFLIRLLIYKMINLYINMFCHNFVQLKSYLHFCNSKTYSPVNHESPKSVKYGRFSKTWERSLWSYVH